MVLNKMIAGGDKTIRKVGFNENAAVRILPKGINTIFTDGLEGCNAVKCVVKGLDGNPIEIATHYTQLEKSRLKNTDVFEKQLEAYNSYIDKNTKPKVFYSIPGKAENGQIVANDSPIIKQLKEVFDKFFKQGYEEKIIPYEAVSKTPFDSKSMISQYSKENEKWGMKLTTVGEKEHIINLWG